MLFDGAELASPMACIQRAGSCGDSKYFAIFFTRSAINYNVRNVSYNKKIKIPELGEIWFLPEIPEMKQGNLMSNDRWMDSKAGQLFRWEMLVRQIAQYPKELYPKFCCN